jgi:hypothetical protein
MKITKQITLTYDIENDKVIFHDLRTLGIALGTSAVSGNFHIYGVEKKGGDYYIAIKTLVDKFERKQALVAKQIEQMQTMAQIVNQIQMHKIKEKKGGKK